MPALKVGRWKWKSAEEEASHSMKLVNYIFKYNSIDNEALSSQQYVCLGNHQANWVSLTQFEIIFFEVENIIEFLEIWEWPEELAILHKTNILQKAFVILSNKENLIGVER